MAVIDAAEAALDTRIVVLDIPKVDWTWPPEALNDVLRALFTGIDLDPDTFQPKPDGFLWSVPEWRAA